MKIFTILVIIAFSLCCCKESSEPSPSSELTQGFTINETSYKIDEFKIYRNKHGDVIKLNNNDFEINLVLSDSMSVNYTNVDTLRYSDISKFKGNIYSNGNIEIINDGEIEFDTLSKTYMFNLETNSFNIQNGFVSDFQIVDSNIISFESVSYKDEFNIRQNLTDSSDWKIRTNFENIEFVVFNKIVNLTKNDTIELSAFPVPFTLFTNVYTFEQNIDELEILLVNENFELIKKYNVNDNKIEQVMGTQLEVDEFARIYYRVKLNSINFYGSGDIVKK